MRHQPIAASGERPAKSGWRATLVFGALFIAAAPKLSAGLFELLFHHDVQVITSTDVTPAGALLRPASPSNPVYYLPLIKGYHVFGVSYGGEKVPSKEEAMRPIVRILADDGYLPADSHHRPTQVIMFAWGSLYPNVRPDPGADPDMPGSQVNYTQTVQFLGGEKLGLLSNLTAELTDTMLPGLTRFDPDADAISHVAREALYVIALAAYEFPVVEPKHPRMLWRTKISCPATGLVMADTLPPMITIAAPYIGRETGRPVWVNANDKFKTDVQIGNLKVEEYLGPGKPPANSGKPAPATTGPSGR